MIERILPPVTACRVAYGAELDHAPLCPEETEAVARAVPKRRAEYAAGRACARAALTALGAGPVPIGRDAAHGAPLWPPGVVGSITHCDGYRAAAVARSADLLGVGIDAEPHGPLPEGVLEAVLSTAAEREALDALLRDAPDVHWDRLLFSAKESVYKVWYPHHSAETMLGFEEAELLFSRDRDRPDRGTYTARVLRDGPLLGGAVEMLHGRWIVGGGLLATAIAVPSPAAS